MAGIVLDMKDALLADADKLKKPKKLDDLRQILNAEKNVQCVLLIYLYKPTITRY